jgi:serine/threonine-protein kinase
MGEAAWGVALPIDPGAHEIEVLAPDYQVWRTSVDVGAKSDSKVVAIPKLSKQAATPTPAEQPGAEPPSASTETPPTPSEPAEPLDSGRPLTTPVIVAGVATVALAAGAGITAGLYLKKKKEYDEVNGGTDFNAIRDSRSSAQTMGTVNLLLTGGAVAGAVATVVLYFLTPERSEPSVSLAPWVGPTGAGASVLTSF